MVNFNQLPIFYAIQIFFASISFGRDVIVRLNFESALVPHISVIIPVLNGIETISRAIKSAQLQTVQDIEIIVIDDASTDGTFEFVSALSTQDKRIKIIRLHDNIGPGAARNEGMKLAKGKWIAVLDADDWIEPIRFEKILSVAQGTGADVVFDNLKIFDHALDMVCGQTKFGCKNQHWQLTAKDALQLDNPFRRSSIGFLKPMIRREFLHQHKLSYDPSHRIGEDFLLLLNILFSGAKVIVLPEAHYTYVHMISRTTRKKALHSKTTLDVTDIIRASDELLAKYGSIMNRDELNALIKRQRHFRTLLSGREMMAAADQGNYAKAIKLVIRRPQILLLIFVSSSKMILAKFAAMLPNLPQSAQF